MSWIYEEISCNSCEENIKYAWQLPDMKIEKRPDNNCIIAEHESYNDLYRVTIKCPNCHRYISKDYYIK